MCRDDAVPASWRLADSQYWHTFQQATAGAQHAHKDLISALENIHAAVPDPHPTPAAATLQSVRCVALTHACICMLGVQLCSPHRRQQLMALLSSGNVPEAAESLQSIISASPHHQHLLLSSVSRAQPHNAHVLTEALEHSVTAVLGVWIKPWQQSFR